MKQHWSELNFHEPFPDDVAELVEMLHEMDGLGLSFRYSGHLPEYQDHVVFLDLAELLKNGRLKLEAAWSYAEGISAPSTTISKSARA